MTQDNLYFLLTCYRRSKFVTYSVTFLFILCIFFFPKPVLAASNFTTDYHVTYTVTENGTTHAVLNATLTNTTTQYYASSYSMQLGFDTVSNVTASDPQGSIDPQITKTTDGYTITLQFNKKAVGMGSQLPFTLSFDTTSVAKQYGKIWEINIPGIANPSDFQNFTVSIAVPPSFGKPVYTKPQQAINSLTFTKDQLGKSGISIAFGDKQYYAFHLTYHLENSHVYPIKTEIALPPSTNYQTIFISSINPRPDNVLEDADGNWMAQYTLLPTQKSDIAVDGEAAVSLLPQASPLSQAEAKQDTAPTLDWQTTSDPIRELSDELRTPEAIYNYVVRTLRYDFSRVNNNSSRLGALAVLKNPSSAVCLEFTDLFIALARAQGIPAREVDRFAYTEDSRQRPVSLVRDILHAWPEYYDSTTKKWIMVDPTWGNTTGGIDYFSTLDFDHLAFVIKGKDSNNPLPAGGYKLPGDTEKKDVAIAFSQTIPNQGNDMTILSQLPNTAIAGLPIEGKIVIENSNQNTLAPSVISLSSNSLSPHVQTFGLTAIPPFGFVTVDAHFQATSLLTKTDAGITIQIADKTTKQAMKIMPFYLTPIGIGGSIIVIFAIFICIIAGQGRRLQVS